MTTPIARSMEALTVRVMVFNIEEGGVGVDLAKVVEAIHRADPDIVALQEAMGNTRRIADALGWPAASARTHVISRWPIVDPPGGDAPYVYVEVRPDEVVAIASVHPPAEPYGPELAWHGGSAADVEALERRIRLPRLGRPLAELPGLVDRGIPVVLLGDFNAPSHLDWTAAAVGLRPHVTTVVDWPMSRALESAAFRDTWREIHPDPVAEPGLTWWAERPPTGWYEPGPETPNDRIDYIYVAGPAETTDCVIVGEVGRADVAMGVEPWPSDHRALVATVRCVPADLPVLVAIEERLVPRGRPLVVRWRRPVGTGGSLAVEPDGPERTLPSETLSGSDEVPTDELAPGRYEVVLRDAAGAVVSRTPFHVNVPGAPVTFRLTASSLRVGEPIDVEWSDAPGNRWDWIAVFAAPADELREQHLIWRHTGARIEGSLRLDADAAVVDQSAVGGIWPLPPGDYVVAYLLDDGPEAVARASLTIEP